MAEVRESPEAGGRGALKTTAPATLIHVLMIALLILLLVYVVPQFEQMFADQGGGLPPSTVALIAVSRFVRGYWWLLAPLVGFLLALDAVFILKLHRRFGKKGVYVWEGVGFLLFLGLGVLVVTALFAPICGGLRVKKFGETTSGATSTGRGCAPATGSAPSFPYSRDGPLWAGRAIGGARPTARGGSRRGSP